MRGPPGSRAPRGTGPAEAAAGSNGGASASAKPKASRFMVYLRLRRKQLLRLALMVLLAALVLLLLVWLLLSLSDDEYHSAEEVKLNGALHRHSGLASSPQRKGRFFHRRRRGRAVHIFSGMGRFRGSATGRGRGDADNSLPLVRNPYASSSGVSQEGGAGGMGLLAGKGTDVYEASRDGEILGRWDKELGLQVDTWDPRTHDPSHPEVDLLGQVIQLQGKAQSQKRHTAGKGAKAAAEQSNPKPYYLTVVTFNRIFPDDPSNISAYECIQWVEFYRYAGASHVVWYDTAEQQSNSVSREMKPYVESGLVTYLHFASVLGLSASDQDMHQEQDQSTVHALRTFGPSTTWLVTVDVDEYIFAPQDVKPGFLERYLRIYETRNPEATQLLMQTFLFVGNPELPLPALLVERYTQRSAESEGVSLQPDSMMKPIVRPDAVHLVYWKHPQHLEMAKGKTMALPAAQLRVNHYWGPRLPEWEFRDKLIKDNGMKEISVEVTSLLKRTQKRGFWSRRFAVAR